MEFLVRAIVDDPEAVQTTEVVRDSGLLLEVSVAKDDMGQVIGAKGHNLRAIRDLVSSCAARHKLRVRIDLLEPPELPP
jgi:predicted RNA-binding protein YlqC (UPF0109 family)